MGIALTALLVASPSWGVGFTDSFRLTWKGKGRQNAYYPLTPGSQSGGDPEVYCAGIGLVMDEEITLVEIN
jgi:hypothetical protein